MKSIRQIIRIAFTGLAILIAASVPAAAGPTKLIPNLSLRQEFLDNILYTKNNEKEDFITIVSGSILLERKTQRLKARANARLDHIMYMDYDQLNDTDKFISANSDYRITERLNMGAGANFSKDSFRGTQLESTGLVLSGDRTRKDFNLSGGYKLTEISHCDVIAGYGQGDIQRALEDEENENLSLRMDYSHDISQYFKNTTFLGGLYYYQFDTEINEDLPASSLFNRIKEEYTSDIWQLVSGFSQTLNELLSFHVQAGVTYTDSQESVTRSTDLNHSQSTWSDGSFSTVFLAGLRYQGLYYDAELSASHDVREGSGTKGTVERTSAAFNLDVKLTDTFSAFLKTSCYLNQNERTTTDDFEELTFNFQPGFQYKLTRDFFFSGGYRFTSIEDRRDNTSQESNLVYLKIEKFFEYNMD
ncbi:MAG: hypothetical protein GY729_20360 [Desulfobacteraceae bacterium]|nr:hypothetical protein [Desulfobacteraceae bacterium]